MIKLSILLCLAAGQSSASSQAEVLLQYPPRTDPKLYEARVGFDDLGNLWMIGKWEGYEFYVERIDPGGNVILDKAPIFEPGKSLYMFPCSPLVFDRWNNLYFMLAMRSTSRVHFFRVTPEGEWRDYYPWPEMDTYGSNFLGITGRDTLMLLGRQVDDRAQYRLSKVVLDSTGLTPIHDEVRHFRELPTYIQDQLPFAQTRLEPERYWGIHALLLYPTGSLDTLYLIDVDLTLETYNPYETLRKTYL